MKEVMFETQRIVATNNKEKIKISSMADLEKLEQVNSLKDKVQEHFIAITLNNKNIIKSIELIGIGTSNCIPMDTSDIVRCAIVRGANKLIVMHNHPSGDTTPSKQDIIFTKRLYSICSYLNIDLLDSIIIGDNYLSIMKEVIDIREKDIEKLEKNVVRELTKEVNQLKEKINVLESNKKIGIKEKIKTAEEISKAQKKENQKVKSKDISL